MSIDNGAKYPKEAFIKIKYTKSISAKEFSEYIKSLDKEYTYFTLTSNGKETRRAEYKKKYSDFVHVPEDNEDVPDEDQFGMPFREYKEENFGCEYYETSYWDNDDEEEEEEVEND